ncbi:MAG: hypothetical protein EPGJADBJ_03431 [Saprospiraceae bacterium]|nr:hypothetical protein [Saprospiraceae bacterium]
MRIIQNSKILYITAALMLLFTVGFSIFFWQKSQSLGKQNAFLSSEIQTLETEKSTMERELDSLTVSYENLRSENEGLRGKEASTTALIAEKDAAIKKIKSQNRRDLATLRQQVEELRKIKIEYETIISTVRSENEQLRAENERLVGENTQLRGENADLTGKMGHLAKQLEEQIRKTQSAKFKATSFRVEVERRNDKLTTRARKAREIFVSFDLADVPQEFQGIQKLYLAITDDKGRPIASGNPVKTTVEAPTGPVAVIAQQVKAVSLNDTQRLSYTYKFDDRLKAGNYVVAIYCDSGLLGAASFRLA